MRVRSLPLFNGELTREAHFDLLRRLGIAACLRSVDRIPEGLSVLCPRRSIVRGDDDGVAHVGAAREVVVQPGVGIVQAAAATQVRPAPGKSSEPRSA